LMTQSTQHLHQSAKLKTQTNENSKFQLVRKSRKLGAECVLITEKIFFHEPM